MSKDPILDRFRHLAATGADKTLFVAQKRRASVAEVDDLSRRMATRINEARIGSGALVGLAITNGPAFAAGYLGLRAAGCRVLLLDARTPADERTRIHETLGAVAEMVCANGWPETADEIEFRRFETGQHSPRLADEISTVRLTSGSSGLPRGIAHTSQALLCDDHNLRSSMGLRHERVLASVPLSHAYGFASIFLPCITRGWTISVPVGTGPFAAIEAATVGEVTFLPTVPAYLQALLKMHDPPPLPRSVRRVITAGAPLKPETAEQFHRQYGQHVHVFYGASEVGGITYDRVGTAGIRGTLGTPVDGVTVQLDPHPGAEPDTGIVTVQSPAAAVGRFPEPDPALGNGRFRTSDLGRFVDGELELLGRVDSMLNIRGKKVNPREVEAELEAMQPIEEAVVLGIWSPDGGSVMIAALVAAGDNPPAVADVQRWCRRRLAAHKIPRVIRFVDVIPRSARGKIDRRAVERLLQQSEPGT